jgi:DNA-binding MarR family transcriptional regulator
MTRRDQPNEVAHDAVPDATTAWTMVCDLVLDNVRRRQVAEALGISFARVRALRRLAKQPMTMGELAGSLGVDAPYATVVVDDFEAQGLVRRRPHPSDRRAKLVETTRKGKVLAKRADEILATPPSGLSKLDPARTEIFVAILREIAETGTERSEIS